MLKSKLSEYIRAVTAGKTVLVTHHERVVAEIVPPQPGRSEMAGDALLAAAVRRGWITPPLITTGVPPRQPCMRFQDLLSDLGEDRGDR
jgi:antitoxin (DNA-binding transcriptional repressor) of toxin-antitoxin stability system